MRLQYFILPALASAAVIETRQLGLGTPLKVVKIEKREPELNDKAVAQITKFGPITVKGKGSGTDSGQQQFMYSIDSGFCKDCTVLKGRVGLLNTDGSKINPSNDVYIHHILSFDKTKKTKTFVKACGGISGAVGLMGAKFIGSGEDNNNQEVWYTNREGETKGGFHVGSNDKFSMQVDLVSYAPATKQIYLTMELEYLKGHVGADARESLLDITGCGGQSIKISQSGPTNSTSGKFTFTDSGTILGAKGHLHAGGEKMVMYINGKFACESKAVYGGAKGPNAIDSMTLCTTKGIPVKKGDTMTMVAEYDVSKHPVRHETHGMGGGMADVMGMFDIIFAG